MIPWHVVYGMSGTIMVLPRDGLTDQNARPLRYDRTYYIGENDFYVPRDGNGSFQAYETPTDSYADTVKVMRGLDGAAIARRVGSLSGPRVGRWIAMFSLHHPHDTLLAPARSLRELRVASGSCLARGNSSFAAGERSMRVEDRAVRLIKKIVERLQPAFAVALWTGERLGPPDGLALKFNDPALVSRILRRPTLDTCCNSG